MNSGKNKLRPNKRHNNKSLKNWLVYKICDSFLIKHSHRYRGSLYDLGCGEAPYREFFLQFADSYKGVDWMQSPHNTQTNIIADLNRKTSIKSEIADCVVSLSVMEHLYEPQVFLNEAFRILKPNGNMILQVPWQWWIHEAPHDYFRYTPYGLKYMLEKAGFIDILIEPQSGFFTMWVLKFNYFSARFIRGPKPLRWLTTALLNPAWTLGQLVAPVLDKADRNWQAETVGYFVTARKS